MSSLCLSLLTPSGDELARLELENVQLAPPGSSAGSLRHSLQEQMELLCSEIGDALAHHDLRSRLDPLDLKIAVSRALLASAGSEPIVVSLPIDGSAEAEPVQPPASAEINGPPSQGADEDLNDLFSCLEENHL